MLFFKMLQIILSFFAVAVLAVVLSSPIVPDTQPAVDGWNALLGPRSFFEGPVNNMQTKSSDDAVIIGQLQQLLAQDDVMTSAYVKYRTIFKKTNDASRERVNQLKKAMLIVARHNLEAAAGKHPWTMAVNHFADMSSSELSMMTGSQSESGNFTHTAVPYKPKLGAPAAPASLNYVEQGVVSSVKSQGQCSTCAMFAATAILESADARTNSRKARDLSPQELADCYKLKHFDCNSLGSDTGTNLQHLVDHGVASLDAYPYTGDVGVTGPCKKDYTPKCASLVLSN